MSVEIKLEQFSGPFDLLLSLIGEQKMSISEIALSEVTEQYLNYLDKIENNRAEELADFLVVATRLLFLKSKYLLPQFTPEEPEGPGLEEQLRLYKAFVDASKKINNIWLNNNKSVFRIEPPRKAEGFVPPENLTLDSMYQSMVKLVHRLKPPKPLPQTKIDKTISLKEKINNIRRLLSRRNKIGFREMLSGAENKTELIVGFLALLELVKQSSVVLNQSSSFEDIMIEKI